MKFLLSLYSFLFETIGLWFVVLLLTFISGAIDITEEYMAAIAFYCVVTSCFVERIKEDT